MTKNCFKALSKYASVNKKAGKLGDLYNKILSGATHVGVGAGSTALATWLAAKALGSDAAENWALAGGILGGGVGAGMHILKERDAAAEKEKLEKILEPYKNHLVRFKNEYPHFSDRWHELKAIGNGLPDVINAEKLIQS